MCVQPARLHFHFKIHAAAVFLLACMWAGVPTSAEAQSLEVAVERLGRKVIAMEHEHRMSLMWTNHAALSESRSEQLRLSFVARMESAQVRLVQGEAAPALKVSIEQTPSRIVFTAVVPAEGRANVAMEDAERELGGLDERPPSGVRLEKEMVWQHSSRLLSAALPPAEPGGERKMILLTDEALVIYREEQGGWKLQEAKPLPGTRQPPRGARGQLVFADGDLEQVGILLPGRRCETNLADESTVACASVAMEWPAGRLLALPACGTQTWWLKSDTTDWTVEDRLLLRNSRSRESAAVAEMSVPGPVQSISAGANAASATVVVRNISTGKDEVYRVAVSCGS